MNDARLADLREQAVFITGAQLIYPFARRIVSDVTRDGGFPPVQLEPVDFVSLYEQQRARAAQMLCHGGMRSPGM